MLGIGPRVGSIRCYEKGVTDSAPDESRGDQLPVIDSFAAYQRVQALVSARREPPRVMKLLVNLFERYRQARRIGWSRPWNKSGTVIFQSFRLPVDTCAELREGAARVLASQLHRADPASRRFSVELLGDEAHLMVFVFLAHVVEDGRRFERITIGLGRVCTDAPRWRDRIDIDLDAEVDGDQTRGISRARVFVDPYEAHRPGPQWRSENIVPSSAESDLFDHVLAAIPAWIAAGREWQHWTADYLDYFGPMRFALRRSCFDASIPSVVVDTPAPGEAAVASGTR